MPTIRQEKAFKQMVENGSTMKDALVKAGYSEKTARAPTKVTKSGGWLKLLDKYIPDRKLTKVLDEGLSATKMQGVGGMAIGIEKGKVENLSHQDMFVPDYAVRHKYLETGLKLKAKFPKEQLEDNLEGLKLIMVQINNVLTKG